MKRIIFLLSSLFFPPLLLAQENTSVYTDLSQCKTLAFNHRPDGIPASLKHCVGIKGYSINVIDENYHENLSIEAPDNHQSTIALNISSVGKKAEWRMKKVGKKLIPMAVIIRVSDIRSDSKAYLSVTKITDKVTCLVERIPVQVSQNELARKSADQSANKTCINFDLE
ncbi:MAG: hypothetical protein KAG10_02670 [Methylococcales bacterium]|nr:hypothetical protein [Methylococcales bacterium]MCK5924776.1 hypothetical protein [Methylococcales bacterium]